MTVKQALATLSAAFRQDKLSQETIDVYGGLLRDIPPVLLQKTVATIVSESRWFPSIAEIRETAARLAGLLPGGPSEALAIIKQADVSEDKYDRAGRYCYTERHWEWPTNVDGATMRAIAATLGSVGDPCDADGKAKREWDRLFDGAYKAKAQEIRAEVLADIASAIRALPDTKRRAITGERDGERNRLQLRGKRDAATD